MNIKFRASIIAAVLVLTGCGAGQETQQAGSNAALASVQTAPLQRFTAWNGIESNPATKFFIEGQGGTVEERQYDAVAAYATEVMGNPDKYPNQYRALFSEIGLMVMLYEDKVGYTVHLPAQGLTIKKIGN